MIGRSTRMAFLTLATWAVLFAPGAAASDAGAGPISAEEVAAAIVAPTFGSDGIVVACRDGDTVDDACTTGVGHLPSVASPHAHDDVSTSVSRPGPRAGSDVEIQQSAPTRAPPGD